jgi:hypothetical protein
LFSASAWVVLSVARTTQIPDPAEVSVKLVTTGPVVPAAACRILAPVAVTPLETITAISVRLFGRYAAIPAAEAVLAFAGTTSEADSTLV